MTNHDDQQQKPAPPKPPAPNPQESEAKGPALRTQIIFTPKARLVIDKLTTRHDRPMSWVISQALEAYETDEAFTKELTRVLTR